MHRAQGLLQTIHQHPPSVTECRASNCWAVEAQLTGPASAPPCAASGRAAAAAADAGCLPPLPPVGCQRSFAGLQSPCVLPGIVWRLGERRRENTTGTWPLEGNLAIPGQLIRLPRSVVAAACGCPCLAAPVLPGASVNCAATATASRMCAHLHEPYITALASKLMGTQGAHRRRWGYQTDKMIEWVGTGRARV